MESLTGKTSEEVEIPKLAENGQNWKIYCAKIIEATATDITDLLGVLAGWQPDNGSYDWECLDAILKWTFYTSVPISILHPIRKLDTECGVAAAQLIVSRLRLAAASPPARLV